jgi:transposase
LSAKNLHRTAATGNSRIFATTSRLAEIIRAVGYPPGGLPGQRLLERLAIRVSDDTILRRIKAAPADIATAQIRNLGVDDWAWRKGQDYGTILMDLDRHRVVDLLAKPERGRFSSMARAVAHCPRRSSAYAEAASLGAPEARQVADRFDFAPESVGRRGESV